MLQLAVRQALKSKNRATSGFRTAWSLTEALGLSKGKEPVDVYAIDPKLVLNPEKLKAADLDKVAARFTVCRELLPKLSRGEPELAEMDELDTTLRFPVPLTRTPLLTPPAAPRSHRAATHASGQSLNHTLPATPRLAAATALHRCTAAPAARQRLVLRGAGRDL
ncbi:hypothetical protein CHLRE_08g378601v5 [Chlamydomonas reinhardtii]|uniref:Uncharacterized protein n=1 Tax=Chlamydomonas reinhardtii TaxID=3055 RepID=A0A2K3DHV9_CHLRE|nr:uncharacterized protein CHLRE_08g378601v5 [Chlamydomonas reinhardtii]PNW80117.1 hypothetical protein CHLRE_08g378601v5 [Chlamydomonas reinhardtii]